MNEPYRDHPHEDALERFLMNQCEEDELEIVETHILACEACVTRLETLELNIAATKMALKSLQAEQVEKLAEPETGWAKWFNWLTLPRLSFAGAGLAACAFALVFSVPRDVDVLANRGTETTLVSEWLPLHMNLDARDLPTGPVKVEIVNGNGSKVWQGESAVQNEKLLIKSPRLTAAGDYFVHVLSPSGEMLREYSIKAKSLFQ